jgi:hypothetical protein
MVASADGDLYTPFPQSSSTMPDESNPSSEEGSGLHSPVFGVQYHGDSNRESLPFTRLRLLAHMLESIKSATNLNRLTSKTLLAFSPRSSTTTAFLVI